MTANKHMRAGSSTNIKKNKKPLVPT